MPKVSLKLVKGDSYFCDGIFSIGVYIKDKTALLIDSGSDDRSAKDANNIELTVLDGLLKTSATTQS